MLYSLAQVEGWGYRTLAVSAADGAGLNRLQETLAGRVSVVAGPSGVGKSSLINALKLRARSGGDAGARSGSSDAGTSAPCSSDGAGSIHASEGARSSEAGSEAGDADLQQAAHEREATSELSMSAELQLNGRANGAAHADPGDEDGNRFAMASSASTSEEEAAGREAGCTGLDAEREEVGDPMQQWQRLREDAAALGLQPVGDLTAIGRGKHTTRHVSLLEVPVLARRPCRGSGCWPCCSFPWLWAWLHLRAAAARKDSTDLGGANGQVAGGLLADSPGFNQPSLEGLTVAELPGCFPEARDKAQE
jgi:ribosome biogenesis GTPase